MEISPKIRSSVNSLWKEAQSALLSAIDNSAKDQVINAEKEGLNRAAHALLEAKIKRETMQFLIAKHWNLTIPDADAVISAAEREVVDQKNSPR